MNRDEMRIKRGIHRRSFLEVAGALAGVAALDRTAIAAPPEMRTGLIDVNVYVGEWPTRRLRGDETRELVSMLRRKGVTSAWTGNFDALLHKDLGAANAWLAEECQRHGKGMLKPFGSVNPAAPDWMEELRGCAQGHRMIGIRLHPNYHGYALGDGFCLQLLRAAADFGLIVQIPVIMEDERMMHPLLRPAAVDLALLPDIVRKVPNLKVVLLNAFLKSPALEKVLSAGRVYLEIAMVEGVGGVQKLLTQIPADRLLYGSYAPFFYPEAALLKLRESPLSREQLQSIQAGNATSLING